MIELEEGSRAAFSIKPNSFRGIARDTEYFRKFTVVPSIEFMVEDLILMVAYAICRNSAIFTRVNTFTDNAAFTKQRIEIYDDLSIEQRMGLYETLKLARFLPKLMFCLFEQTSLQNTIAHLREYQMKCWVTNTIFIRERSAWHPGSGWVTKGNLEVRS
uniref:Uncharacterized protein n=1 Tax=Candidatus Nitrotoga fabula TaxID=2182327 RepID=A0A2X0RDK2_9PROT|nr:protein of unknown function [Candidatus Nitrotoga fabula]